MVSTRKKIFLVAGARPNFMKIAPIMRALRKHDDVFECQLIHTGQHYDKDMSDVFFQELAIPRPDCFLEAGSGTHAEQTAKTMTRFEKLCVAERPHLVIVVGDVNSTLACSIAAKKLQISVAHVEAGLRSRDMQMPEEINRVVTDAISDYFFVTERSGVENLLAEGKPKEKVHFVGHVMIDNLLYQIAKLTQLPPQPTSASIKRRFPTYGVVTLHRPSNVDNAETLQRIVTALQEIGVDLPLVLPLHPRTRSNLEQFRIVLDASIVTTGPLPFMEFLDLWKDASLVLTDSGGLQEETTALGVPCVTLRENTERPVTVTEGTNVVAGTSPARIIAEARRILEGRGKSGKIPELWDGRASERIVSILYQSLCEDPSETA